MSIDWQNYSIQQLRAHAVKTFRAGGGSRPDVLLIEIDGYQAVLKDQGGADKWFAALIGPILNWRECKALIKLAHLDCVPNLLCKPNARAFVMSYHDSEQITSENISDLDWPVFFARLRTAVDQLHASGVAHNDLRNPTNTLVTPQGGPILVDLVACFCLGQSWNIPNQWLFNKFAQVDLSAITKLKTRYAPELLSADDVLAEDIAGKAGMRAKNLGQLIRRLSRKLFTR